MFFNETYTWTPIVTVKFMVVEDKLSNDEEQKEINDKKNFERWV